MINRAKVAKPAKPLLPKKEKSNITKLRRNKKTKVAQPQPLPPSMKKRKRKIMMTLPVEQMTPPVKMNSKLNLYMKEENSAEKSMTKEAKSLKKTTRKERI